MNWKALFAAGVVGIIVMNLFWYGLYSQFGIDTGSIVRILVNTAFMYGLMIWFTKLFTPKNNRNNDV
jgi:drug/metabolite transporter (DMT)-like permease